VPDQLVALGAERRLAIPEVALNRSLCRSDFPATIRLFNSINRIARRFNASSLW
jgi:hypothetical protein